MNTPFHLLGRAAACVALALPVGLLAQAPPSDIDIYAGISGTQDRPNVLFVLDSSANWAASISGAANCYYNDNGVPTTSGPTADQGTKVAIEKCALYNLVDAVPVAGAGGPDGNALFNVGFMLMNEPNNNGGYPRKAFVPLSTTNKATLKAMIAGFTKNGDKGNNADYGQALYESFLLFKAISPYNGTLCGTWTGAAASRRR